MQLFIGNKNYSSWSMRPWLAMRQAGIAFDEVMLRFDAFDTTSRFKTEVMKVSGAARVPVLVDDDGLAVWDSLAICEYLAERHPERPLWPRDRAGRARARSACAEMHAGFSALRQHLTMNIEADLPDVGRRVLAEQPAVRADVDRIVQLWGELLAASGGPFLGGAEPGIVDAFFAPVVMRFRTYAVPLSAVAAGYATRVEALLAVDEWVRDARAEHDFVAFDEPYRTPPVVRG